MKKVMLLVAIAVSIAFTSCSDSGGVNTPTKYRILDADGRSYFTDEYTLENGCIKFECEQLDITICGSFTIVN